MDKQLQTITNIAERSVSEELPLLETQGNIKPAASTNGLTLIGTWMCALMISSPFSTTSTGYSISTSIKYPHKSTQSNIVYYPHPDEDDLLNDEVSSNVFVKTKPERSYAIKLNIIKQQSGKPIIESENNTYES